MSGSLQEIAQTLLSKQRILILTHQNPDGDTLGSGFGLYYALKQLGKQANVICSDMFPHKYCYLFENFREEEFDPDCVIAVDVADPALLGDRLSCYQNQVDICVDHHPSNKQYASVTYVDSTAAATCEIIYQLILDLGAEINRVIANCLYTGLSTDTGCFKFSNTTARTHRIAAELFEYGCDYESINRILFDTKSKSRIMVEKNVLDTMEFYCDHRIAMIVIPQDLVKSTGIDASELDGVSALPRQIEGVEIGVTLREKVVGGYKVSVRTSQFVDASELCAKLGGGGHQRAAGCTIDLPLAETKKALLDVMIPYFKQ
jgi:phosphoesterase RecJ-like protein